MEAPSAPPPILLPGIALPPCRQEIRSVTAIFCGDKQDIRSVKDKPFYWQSSVEKSAVSRACLSTAAVLWLRALHFPRRKGEMKAFLPHPLLKCRRSQPF